MRKIQGESKVLVVPSGFPSVKVHFGNRMPVLLRRAVKAFPSLLTARCMACSQSQL